MKTGGGQTVLVLHIPAHLHIQGRHFGSLRWAVLGESTPRKLAKAIKQAPSKTPKSTLLKNFAPVVHTV